MTPGPARTAFPDVACRLAAGWLACAMLGLSAPTLHAAEVALYRATVPLGGSTEADRQAAFAAALRAVVVRASGRRDAGSNPQVSASAGRAQRLVQQYSATDDGQLRVGFDAATIEDVLAQAGLPAWPSERPATLVVLAAAGAGTDPRVLRAGEAAAERTQLEHAAQARGVPLVWPVAATTVDAVQAQLSESGVDGAARLAGTPADAVLIGRSSGGEIEWTLVHAGQSSRKRGPVGEGVHFAADQYAEFYAPPSTRGSSTAVVHIDGVDSLQAYAALMRELESLSMVRGISVGELDRTTLRLELNLRGDLELLRRIAMLTPNLRPATGADAAAPQFVYLP